LLLGLVIAALASPWAGCGSDELLQTGTSESPPEIDRAVVLTEAGPLIEAQNRRVEALPRLYASGTITIRWIEDGRKRMEQGNVELWRDGQDRFALRIYKAAIGEEFLWLGGDAGRFWLFDLRQSDAVSLTVRPSARTAPGDENAPIMMTPAAIIELMGLASLPPLRTRSADGSTRGKTVVEHNAEPRDVTLRALGRTGPLRMIFDRERQLPRHVELLGPDGSVLARSELPLEQYESVEQDDMPIGAYPKLPMRIIVQQSESDDQSIKIELGSATGRAEEGGFKNRLFDLEVLTRRFQPSVIDDMTSASASVDAAPPTP
jgi:hypothetical protein